MFASSGCILNEPQLQVDTSIATKTKPLGEIVIPSRDIARVENLIQRDGGVTNFVIAERVLVHCANMKLVLSGTDLEEEGLIVDRVDALVVLGALLVRLIEPHLDERIIPAEPILVAKIGCVVQLDVQLTLLGSHDMYEVFGVDSSVGNRSSHCDGRGEEGNDEREELHIGC